MAKVYRVHFKRKIKNHCQTKIKVHCCTTNNVPPCDIRDEFSTPELHLSHPNHQLIPGNSSYTYHQTPSFSQEKKTGIIKNLPKANVPKQPPTSPEPTQSEGLNEGLIRELEERRNLRKDSRKTRNLESIISIIHCIKRLEDTPYKEAVNTGSTTST